jgi:hypothetical protein
MLRGLRDSSSDLLFHVDFITLDDLLDDLVVDPYFAASGFVDPTRRPPATDDPDDLDLDLFDDDDDDSSVNGFPAPIPIHALQSTPIPCSDMETTWIPALMLR